MNLSGKISHLRFRQIMFINKGRNHTFEVRLSFYHRLLQNAKNTMSHLHPLLGTLKNLDSFINGNGKCDKRDYEVNGETKKHRPFSNNI